MCACFINHPPPPHTHTKIHLALNRRGGFIHFGILYREFCVCRLLPGSLNMLSMDLRELVNRLCVFLVKASIVHTAEMSMHQIFNLVLCYILRVFFNIGRDSAIESLRYKFISFVLVVSSLTFLNMVSGVDVWSWMEKRTQFSTAVGGTNLQKILFVPYFTVS